MENASLVALSKQMVLRRQMDLIANNIANANTDGFKAERMLFATYLQPIGPQGTAAFVQDIAVAHDLREGDIATTGNPLDIAIKGEGFLPVDTTDGVRYTRGGHFRLDKDGVIVTSNGHPLLGDDGFPIIAAPGDTDIAISPDGVVTAEGGIEIGRLAVVTFDNLYALTRVAGGLYRTDQTPIPADRAEIVQGAVERSNVEPVVEMTRMIALLRSYQSTQRLIQQQDQLRQRAIGVLSGASQSA